MKKNFLILALITLVSIHSLSHAEVVDRVVAFVGNEIVTLSDVKHYSNKNSLSAKFGLPPLKDPLEALLRDKILKAEMDRLGVYASDQDIEAAIQEVLKKNQAPLEVLKAEIAKKGISFDQYKKNLGEQLTHMKFMGQVIFPRIKVSDEDILKKANGDSSEEARYKARLTLLEQKAPEEIEKYLEEARAKTYVEIKK